MAEITNAQVVAFANNRVRPLADKLNRARNEALEVLADYNAQGIGSLINAAGDSNLIADGSAVDGRPRMSGGDIYNLVTLIDALTTTSAFFTTDRATVVKKCVGNGG